MPVIIQGQRTRLRPAALADAEMLAAWHADPEVSRYWDDETFTVDEMRRQLLEEDIEPYIVEAASEPIGYLQIWADETGGGGLDMFLIPKARGKRLGPDAARAAALHLLRRRGWTHVTVDPYDNNPAAIRAWERAGFEPVSSHGPDEDHRRPWLLMRFRAVNE